MYQMKGTKIDENAKKQILKDATEAADRYKKSNENNEKK